MIPLLFWVFPNKNTGQDVKLNWERKFMSFSDSSSDVLVKWHLTKIIFSAFENWCKGCVHICTYLFPLALLHKKSKNIGLHALQLEGIHRTLLIIDTQNSDFKKLFRPRFPPNTMGQHIYDIKPSLNKCLNPTEMQLLGRWNIQNHNYLTVHCTRPFTFCRYAGGRKLKPQDFLDQHF